MPNYVADLNSVFHALADLGRRLMLERLGQGPASVSELGKSLPMSLAAVVQHVQVGPCEITLHFWREKDGRSRWRVASMSARAGTAAEEVISVMDEPGTSQG